MPITNGNHCVLITGASGAVGPRVVRTFYEEGYRIRTLSIEQEDSLFPEGVESLIGDVTCPDSVARAISGVKCVVHLAALLHIDNPPSSFRSEYERVNLGGTTVVVDASRREGVERVVFFSTIAVYGPGMGHILDEDSLPAPDSFYAQTKLAGERVVLSAVGRDGKSLGTILRLGAVYGSRIKGNYRRLVQSLARRRFIQIGDGCNRRTLVYDRDVASAAVAAARHPSAAGRIYNVTDGRFHAMNEIVAAVCRALNRWPPRVSISAGLARYAAGVLEDGARLFRTRSSIVRATVEKYLEDIAVSGERIRSELGFEPRFDLIRGWSETIDEMRRLGEI